MSEKIKEIKVQKVVQPIGIFYTAVMSSNELYKLSKADIIEIQKGQVDSEVPYDGIQRPLLSSKINSIKNYLTNQHATFPNSIIINLNPKYKVSIDDKTLKIYESQNTFSILDGQHRLEGLNQSKIHMDVVVSIFDGIDTDLQNDVFDTINTEQTKVNKSITLYKQSLSKLNTPLKFASQLSLSFAMDKNSVWKDKIKILGIKDEYSENGIISLQSFSRPIIDFIYDNEDYYLIKQELEENGNSPLEIRKDYNTSKHIFWLYYKEQNIKLLYKVLDNYFRALSEILSLDFSDPKSIIQKTTGYNASMKIFKDLYIIGFSESDLTYDFFISALTPLKELEGRITTDYFQGSGDSSARKLYEEFKALIFKNKN